jgi:hypothetical protein
MTHESKILDDRIRALEYGLNSLEEQLTALQVFYEETIRELQELRGCQKALSDYRLGDIASLTWVRLCHRMRWPSGGRAHATVKRRDPRLHMLLHISGGAYCVLDRVSYMA